MGKIRKYQSCTVVWRNVGVREVLVEYFDEQKNDQLRV